MIQQLSIDCLVLTGLNSFIHLFIHSLVVSQLILGRLEALTLLPPTIAIGQIILTDLGPWTTLVRRLSHGRHLTLGATGVFPHLIDVVHLVIQLLLPVDN